MEMAAHVLPVRSLQVGHHTAGVVRPESGIREAPEAAPAAPAVFPAGPQRIEGLALRRAGDLQIRTREGLPILQRRGHGAADAAVGALPLKRDRLVAWRYRAGSG